MAALKRRVFKPLIRPVYRTVLACGCFARSMYKDGAAPYDGTVVYQRYRGAKLEKMKSGFAREGIAWGGALGFVKAERCEATGNKVSRCRMIQYRSDPGFNTVWLTFTSQVEKLVYQLRTSLNDRLVAKGLNRLERGRRIAQMLSNFKYVVSLDSTSFDASQHLECLSAIEFGVYREIFTRVFGGDALAQTLDEIEKTLLHSKVKTAAIFWELLGQRLSGDMNTALGNIVLQVAYIAYAMYVVGVDGYDLFDDGDDALIGVHDLEFVEAFCAVGVDLGQQWKLEEVATSGPEVEFCQSRVIRVMVDGRLEPVCVRNPTKVYNSLLNIPGTLSNGRVYPKREAVVGAVLCEAQLSVGVPILQEFTQRLLGAVVQWRHKSPASLIEWYTHVAEEKRDFSFLRNAGMSIAPQCIPLITRLDFADAYGISPADQVRIEAILAAWEPDLSPQIPMQNILRDYGDVMLRYKLQFGGPGDCTPLGNYTTLEELQLTNSLQL